MIRCSMPRCKELAEISWTTPKTLNTKSKTHQLCGACMSRLWGEINLKFDQSNTQQASIFEEIKQ